MKQYLRTLIISLILAFLVLAVVNYLFDPLGYFRLNDLRTSSFMKDKVWGDIRTSKALALSTVQPETLLVGTSRVGNGFNVKAPAIRRYLGQAYNLALSGGTFDEFDLYVRYAMQYHTPTTLIIGLDYGQFLLNQRKNSLTFMEEISSPQDSLGSLLHRLRYVLWSRALLEMAVMPYSHSLEGVSNVDKKANIIKKFDAYAVTKKTETSIIKRWSWKFNGSYYAQRMASLDQLLADTCAQGIQVKLFISPYHIRQLLLLKIMGLQEAFLNWKGQLNDIYEQHQKVNCPVSLMDFSRISTYTSEKFPSLENKESPPQWFWESSHYKFALGELMIKRLWEIDKDLLNFGVKLDGKVIHHEINASRDELNKYYVSHPELVRELRELVTQQTGQHLLLN